MAQKVTITLTDDLDGSEATETVAFGVDGTTYEIDLNEGNAAALRDALSEYVAKARKVSGKTARKASKTAQDGPSAKEIREWAKAQGMEAGERGRVPAEVREAYLAAH